MTKDTAVSLPNSRSIAGPRCPIAMMTHTELKRREVRAQTVSDQTDSLTQFLPRTFHQCRSKEESCLLGENWLGPWRGDAGKSSEGDVDWIQTTRQHFCSPAEEGIPPKGADSFD